MVLQLYKSNNIVLLLIMLLFLFKVFRKTLTRMFSERDEDIVFMETSKNLKHFPHMSVECIPMDKEVGDLAPIYFKVSVD